MSADEFVITQPAGTRTLALRESYMAICEGDACEAHLLNALERWYAYKLKIRDESRGRNKAAAQSGEAADADEALWVRMSAGQWATKELLAIYNEKTVRTKLARLVERGYVLTRENPRLKWDRTPQWLLNRTAVQAAVNTWADGREDVDLDPSEADELENADSAQSDTDTKSIRKNVRVQSEEVPNQVGQSSALTRKNVRSNNTGILSQESSTAGEHNVIGNARATGDQAAPVDEPSSAPITTENASRQKAPQGLSGDASGVEAQAPHGEAAHAAQERCTASVQVLDQPTGGQFEQATSIEDVPGGAAGAGLDLEAALDFAPHDPQQTRVVLERALGGAKKLTALMDETPPGLRDGSRSAWLSQITPERAAELVTQGRAQQTMHPWTAITQLLDQEIGARIKHGSAPQVEANNGHAYLTAEEKAALQAGLPPVTAGEQWASRRSGKAYLIEEVTSQSVFVQDAGEYPIRKFHTLFEPAEATA